MKSTEELTPKQAQAKRDVRREAWRIVSNIVVPILFVALIPGAIALGIIQHSNSKHDKKAASNDRRITAIALWDRYDNDVAGCRRGNKVRAHIRGNDLAVKSVAQILAPYLATSAKLRKQAQASNDKAALQALGAAEDIATVAKGIKPLPDVKCLRVIRAPSLPRPVPLTKGKL